MYTGVPTSVSSGDCVARALGGVFLLCGELNKDPGAVLRRFAPACDGFWAERGVQGSTHVCDSVQVQHSKYFRPLLEARGRTPAPCHRCTVLPCSMILGVDQGRSPLATVRSADFALSTSADAWRRVTAASLCYDSTRTTEALQTAVTAASTRNGANSPYPGLRTQPHAVCFHTATCE